MNKKIIEAQRRRKAAPPTGRAEAPRRETGGGQSGGGGFQPSGGGFQRPSGGGLSTRGKQAGGCGSIVILIIIVAFYLFFNNGQIDLSDQGSDPPFDQDPYAGQPQQPDDSFSAPVSNFTPPVAASGSGQTWTVMLYQDADDKILEKDIFVDLNEAERVGSSDRVRIVAQFDRFAGAYQGDGNWSGTRRYYVTQDSDLNSINSEVVQELGEVDMADGGSLVDFVQWSVATFPADHYVLILSDHGMGWPGGWSDPDPGGSDSSRAPLASRLGAHIYLNELDQALLQSRQAAGIDRFEMIGMDACLMAQLEVMAALQPHAHYAVASEETEPALGWAYASFLGDLVTNPDMDGARLSQLIVQSYIADDQRISDPAARADFLNQGSPLGGIFGGGSSAEQLIAQMEQDITISAIDLERLPELMQSANNFAYMLQNEDQGLVAEARRYAQSYTSIFGREVPPAYIDLGHFAALLAGNTSDQGVKQAAEQLIADLQSTVIAERHGSRKKGSTGLAIYFPNSTLYSSPLSGPQSYTAIAERFASQSLWDDFLAFHYMDRGFEPQTREAVIPGSGVPVRAPGQGAISVSEISVSSSVATADQPVNLSMDISGENIGYIYLFVGYLDAASNSIAVLDTDFLESQELREVSGVYYPVWDNDFTLSFNWEPTVFAINDGQTRTTALFTPQAFGASAEQAIYTVDGIYTFADSGESVNAQLYFQNGNLVQIFGITGEGETGAPREITPQMNDTFTILQKWFETTSSGETRIVYENGETLIFGANPFVWEQLYAAAGEYLVGFIIEDLDGNQYPVYTQITVQ
ncbi:MAG: clostripain-related cysteine peptidase [Anaerolineales bacterium]